MNIIIFRSLIVLVIIAHITFINLEPPSVYNLEMPIYILPENVWFTVYFILFLSLGGLFFLYKFFRLIFIVTIVISMGIVATQGGVAFSPLENALVQLSSGLYGGIITMAYFGNIQWRSNL